jgi:hypothetical protein
MLHIPVGFGLLAAAAAALFLAAIRRQAVATTVLLTVFVALAINAFLGGALSAGGSRYQNRMIPLLPIVVAVAAIDLATTKRAADSPSPRPRGWAARWRRRRPTPGLAAIARRASDP